MALEGAGSRREREFHLIECLAVQVGVTFLACWARQICYPVSHAISVGAALAALELLAMSFITFSAALGVGRKEIHSSLAANQTEWME